MNKENNKSAAGLRRSAIAERIRLREEWSELKGTSDSPLKTSNRPIKTAFVLKVPKGRNCITRPKPFDYQSNKKTTKCPRIMSVTSEVLAGVVALVDVGVESRALALRAALTALGASVVPMWTPIVTHLIWSQGGCRATRAKARALACRLVSPLWVEACAASNSRLSEQSFPAAARASDLPSPRTLRQLLKKAEMENISLLDLLAEKEDESLEKPMRLRISSDTDHDTTADTSRDTSRDSNTEIETRVNTAPRRAMPISISPPKPIKSKRKLFTQKEAEDTKARKASDDESEAETIKPPIRAKVPKPAVRDRRDLARAERMAKRLVAACGPKNTQPSANITVPRIVLTGMGRTERQAVTNAILSLKGRIQSHVTRKTTHVLLGSCTEDCPCTPAPSLVDRRTSPRKNLSRLNMSGVSNINNIESRVVHRSEVLKARTLNALLGAARGCRVLTGQWAVDSAENKKWLHHHGYEVPHLKKISLKARLERKALGRMRTEYAYDVFNGMRVRISPNADQKDSARQLLQLCGAVVQDGGTQQNGGRDSYDVIIGSGDGEVNSKWVFDSVAAARMRTTRRYVNNSMSNTLTLTDR